MNEVSSIISKSEKGWFSYTWEYDGLSVETEVDSYYYQRDDLLMGLPYAFTIHLTADKSGKISALLKPSLKRAVAWIEKQAQSLGIEIVARRATMGEKEVDLFFYSPSDANIHLMIERINQKKIEADTCFAQDNDWNIYNIVLYPNMAQRQRVWNQNHCQEMSKIGDNTTAVRSVNYYIHFDNENQRAHFVQLASQVGYAIGGEFYTPDDQRTHGCIIGHRNTLEIEEINKHTTRLCTLAEETGGEFVYWDCKCVKSVINIKKKSIADSCLSNDNTDIDVNDRRNYSWWLKRISQREKRVIDVVFGQRENRIDAV